MAISTVVGIDPGMTGAMVLLTLDGNTVLDVYDFESDDGRVLPAPLVDTFNSWNTESMYAAVVENVHSMPKQGVSTTFKFGRATGSVEMLPAASHVRSDFITPAQWKKYHKLTGKSKDAARALAMRVWPSESDYFAEINSKGQKQKAKAQARADAALLALCWLRKNPPTPTTPQRKRKSPRRAE